MSFFAALRDRVFGTKPAPAAPPRAATCPLCQQPLQRVAAGPSTLEECAPCGGMWVRHETLKELLVADAAVVEPLFSAAHKEADHKYNDQKPDRTCPDCGETMENYVFGYSSDVWIDACPNDHGAWLDGGELKKLWDYKKRVDNPTPGEQAQMAACIMFLLDKDSRHIIQNG